MNLIYEVKVRKSGRIQTVLWKTKYVQLKVTDGKIEYSNSSAAHIHVLRTLLFVFSRSCSYNELHKGRLLGVYEKRSRENCIDGVILLGAGATLTVRHASE